MDESFVIKLEDLLLVTVPAHLLDSEIIICRRAVLRGIREHGVSCVLLNFAEVEICDSLFGRFVQGMSEMARLMGVQVMVSGLQDSVVETMVELGFDLPGIETVLDVDEAISRLARRRREADSAPGAEPPESVPATGWETDWE